jgi:LuxR family maltose regulon positive regulatory protein
MGVTAGVREVRRGAPPLPAAIIDRPAVVERLDDCLHRQLGLVVAPAGSGKTVLLTQWLARHPELPVAWLALDRSHNDTGRFARDLLSALAAILPELDPDAVLSELASGGVDLGDRFVELLVAELGEVTAPCVVVLDDFHVLASPRLVHDLGQLISQLPRQCHLVIAARSDPGLPLQRMRVSGEVVVLRERALAFDVPAARALLAAVGAPPIDEPAVEALVTRTEGWAAGLQLAGLSLREAPHVDRFVAEFAGDDRFVADYLTEEVLAQQSPPVRSFLLRTSALTMFSAELAEAVTGGRGAAALIEELQRRALFVVPVDHHRGWFRYHHLFQDLLRYHLRAEAHGLERAVRVRAAVWHLDRGDWRGAAEYLVASQAWELALDIVNGHGHELFERSEGGTLLRWLTAIAGGSDDTDVRTQLPLLVAQVVSDHAFAAEETYYRLARRHDLLEGQRACADVLLSILVQFHLPAADGLAAADRALARLPALADSELPDVFGLTDRDSLEIVARLSRAKALAFLGRSDEATAAFDEAAAGDGVRYPLWRIHVLGGAAQFHAALGDLVAAHHEATEALAIARETGTLDHVATTDAHLALGAVALERHEVESAATHLSEGRARAERCRRFANLDLHRGLRARLDAATVGNREALATLRQPSPGPYTQATTVEAHAALAVRFLVGAGELALARGALAHLRVSGAAAHQVHAAATVIAVATGEIGEARRALDQWIPPAESPGSAVERTVWEAVVLDAEGDTPGAHECLRRALMQAEPQQHRRPFLDAGATALRLLRHLERRQPSPFGRSVLEAEVAGGSRRDAARRLVEPLTDRELAVLSYLPGRLSNAEIAGELYVSLNTVKTHVRNIYRKLEVVDRDAAVDRAAELGLL